MTIEKPILFSEEMYRKIVAGEKTMTRRVIKPQLEIKTTDDGLDEYVEWKGVYEDFLSDFEPSAPHPVGSLIWVKEPFRLIQKNEKTLIVKYSYDGETIEARLTDDDCEKISDWKEPFEGKSSLLMFKSLARLWLKVTAVRVERLHYITIGDIKSEGICIEPKEAGGVIKNGLIYRQKWIDLWDSINGKKYPWVSNPWVWVYTFEKTAG